MLFSFAEENESELGHGLRVRKRLVKVFIQKEGFEIEELFLGRNFQVSCEQAVCQRFCVALVTKGSARVETVPPKTVEFIASALDFLDCCATHCEPSSRKRGFGESRLGSREGVMTRGNQREKDRERAAARAQGKGKEDGLTPVQRRERDAKALQEKNAKKAAETTGGGTAAPGKAPAKK